MLYIQSCEQYFHSKKKWIQFKYRKARECSHRNKIMTDDLRANKNY